MDTKDLSIRVQGNLTKSTQDQNLTRAKSFQVKTTSRDFSQYVRTIKAYALAGMSFEHIANAGDYLGDEVERKDIDVSLQQGWQGKEGEVAEDDKKILAWQSRGERVLVTQQLSAPQPVKGNEMMIASKGITTKQEGEQVIDVLEGIEISKQNTSRLPNSVSSNNELENNPYLIAKPSQITKAY